MKKYEVTLTAHYGKTVSVYADSPEEAREKLKTVLFDTDLVRRMYVRGRRLRHVLPSTEFDYPSADG